MNDTTEQPDIDLEAMSQAAVVFIESDYGKYLYNRIRAMHFAKHEAVERALDVDMPRLMHEAAALHDVIAMIDEDVALHKSKYFENVRQEEQLIQG